MKTLISKYWLVLMALVSVSVFTACSSDDDDAVTPVFPQVQTITGAAGDELDFTFDANMNWSLSSSAIWCKLVQGDNTAFVLNGAAGKQTVKVKLTADEESKDMSVAQLYLTMGGQKISVAEVSRSAAGYELKVYVKTSENEEIDVTKTGLTVGYKNIAGQPIYNKFYVKSNYRFAVTNTPAWVDIEGGFMVGTPNKEAEGGLAFKENAGLSAKYAVAKDDNYTITFTSEDGKAAVTVPVIFDGMTADIMDITYPTSNQWAVWNVSMDGAVYTQNGSSLNNDATNAFTFNNFVPFKLSTLNDAYQLVVFETDKQWGLKEDMMGAVQLQGEKGDMKLTVAPLASGSREFFVYALPQSVFESLGNGTDDMLEEDFTTVKSDYDRYFLMNIVQKEKSNGGAEVQLPLVTSMGMDVNCALTESEEFKMYAEGLFSYTGKDVFEATVYGGYVCIYPQIDGWNPTKGNGSYIIGDGTGNPVEGAEVGQDEKGIYIGFPTDGLTFPIMVGFNDANFVCQRVVFITNMGFRSIKK